MIEAKDISTDSFYQGKFEKESNYDWHSDHKLSDFLVKVKSDIGD